MTASMHRDQTPHRARLARGGAACGLLLAASLLGASLWSAPVAAAGEPAAAAEAGHEGAHGAGHGPTPHWDELIAAIVNFAVYAGIIYVFAGKPVSRAYAARRDKIASAIEASRRAAEEARAALAAAEARSATLDAEKRRILDEARSMATAEAERIDAGIEPQVQKVLRDAAALGELEARVAEARFRERRVGRALAQARDEVSHAMTAELQGRLIDASIDRLGKQPAASTPTV